MTARGFVACCAREKDELVRSYFRDPHTAVGARIAALELSPKKRRALRAILDGALTDALYTLLLALDGEASLGGVQMPYSLRDENGRELTGGQLEVEAWKRFHGPAATSPRRRKRRRPSQ